MKKKSNSITTPASILREKRYTTISMINPSKEAVHNYKFLSDKEYVLQEDWLELYGRAIADSPHYIIDSWILGNFFRGIEVDDLLEDGLITLVLNEEI